MKRIYILLDTWNNDFSYEDYQSAMYEYRGVFDSYEELIEHLEKTLMKNGSYIINWKIRKEKYLKEGENDILYYRYIDYGTIEGHYTVIVKII